MIERETLQTTLDRMMRAQLADTGRDYGIYRRSMDAAVQAKAQAMFPHFGEIEEGDVIVDAGCGTGALAKLAARTFRGAHVYAVDLAPDLIELATQEQYLIKLVYGNIIDKHFPDNSVKVKYFSSSPHEIVSFGGIGAMITALEVTYQENVPGGENVIRDFIKPSRTEPLYMKILSPLGYDHVEQAMRAGEIDYSLLSTRALFERFHQEFRGGNAFSYENKIIGGDSYIEIDPEWAYEFYMRKDYTENWQQEIKEKYSYWTTDEAKEVEAEIGYNPKVFLEHNPYIMENRLKGQISLFEMGHGGRLREINFPPTHMVVVGEKPKSKVRIAKPEEITSAVDYERRINSVEYDEEKHTVTIDDQVFTISPDHPPQSGSKRTVYRLANEPGEVLKVVRPDVPNMHAVFKAMHQAIKGQSLLEQKGIPHLHIDYVDPKGPPYLYYIQREIPPNSESAAEIIKENRLTETDIAQIASYVNAIEKSRQNQLDTNPFNWYRVTKDDGTTEMTYVDGKVYLYDEDWEFRKIGLLQWLNPKYVSSVSSHSAAIPLTSEYEELRQTWIENKDEQVLLWKKYLRPQVQPT